MNKATLELLILVEADETALKDIENMLGSQPDLSTKLTDLIEENLKDAVNNKSLKVFLKQNRVITKSTGGLNAQEWLEAGGLSSD